MECESWRDFYIFLKDYCKFSCLNCFYGGARLDLSEEHSDNEYARLFCTENISMIRLDFQTICSKWQHHTSRKQLKDFVGEDRFDFSDEVADILDNTDKKWTIKEIRSLIEDDDKTDE